MGKYSRAYKFYIDWCLVDGKRPEYRKEDEELFKLMDEAEIAGKSLFVVRRRNRGQGTYKRVLKLLEIGKEYSEAQEDVNN